MRVRPMILRFWAGVTAGFILVVAATLMALTLVPVLLGLMSATVVGTASMAPALLVGDVVLVDDVDGLADSLAPPTVVLADDPTRDELLLHRIVGISEDGDGYLTKGDANPENDSAVLPPERVLGTGRVVVPLIGTPVVWLADGNLTAVGLTMLAIVGLSWLARFGWSDRFDPWPHTDTETQTETEPDDHSADDIDDLGGFGGFGGFGHDTEPAAGATPGWKGGRTPVLGPAALPQHARGLLPPLLPLLALMLLVVVGGAGPVPTASSALMRLSVSTSAFAGTTATALNSLVTATLQPPTGLSAATRCVAGPAPTVAGSATASSTGDVTVAMPSQVVAGDLLLAHVVNEDKVMSGPAGWSLLNETAAPGALKAQIWQRVATSTDASTSYTWPTVGKRGTIAVLAVRGAAGLVSAANAAGATAKSFDSTAPSQTVTVANSLLVTMHSLMRSNASFTTPSGMTKRYEFSDIGAVAGFSEVRVSTGATGTRTSSSFNTDNVAQSLVAAPVSTPKVDLVWTPTSSSYATGHQVLRSGVSQAILTPRTVATWTDENPGTGARTYDVRARAGAWQSLPASVSITPTC